MLRSSTDPASYHRGHRGHRGHRRYGGLTFEAERLRPAVYDSDPGTASATAPTRNAVAYLGNATSPSVHSPPSNAASSATGRWTRSSAQPPTIASSPWSTVSPAACQSPSSPHATLP